jgi:hypothetical protein
MRHTGIWLSALLTAAAACGYGSINPTVSEADATFEPRLIGSWQNTDGKEAADIARDGATGYVVTYREGPGKAGRFRARLGRIGTFRALDLVPIEMPEGWSDLYKDLLLPLHVPIILDSIGETLQFHFIDGDSIRSFLARRPGEAAHILRDNAIVLTGPTEEVQRLLGALIPGPGVLTEPNVWRRRQP